MSLMYNCFNTQPPEGGWRPKSSKEVSEQRFNTQPPEGGWLNQTPYRLARLMFQHTAARRRLGCKSILFQLFKLFQHTAARRRLALGHNAPYLSLHVSTHSRPKAAGSASWSIILLSGVSTHSRPKAAGLGNSIDRRRSGFQHTAARRRLVDYF